MQESVRSREPCEANIDWWQFEAVEPSETQKPAAAPANSQQSWLDEHDDCDAAKQRRPDRTTRTHAEDPLADWCAVDRDRAAPVSKTWSHCPDRSREDSEDSVDEYSTSSSVGGENHRKFIVCDHCHSHGLPCDEEAVCEQCVYHGLACVHHWCTLSKRKATCPRPECRYVHKDYIPVSDALPGIEWLILPGNLRPYLAAGRKGMMYGYGVRNRNSKEDKVYPTIADIKAVQEEGLKEMTSCVTWGGATWETVILECSCATDEFEENEEKLKSQMARNRRGADFTVRYK